MLNRLTANFKSYWQSLRYAYQPLVAKSIMWSVAKVAMLRSGRGSTDIKVLIDSQILSHAVTHKEAMISTGTVLWGGVHPVENISFARVPVHSETSETEDYEDICYLGSLVGLARYGPVKFVTSYELIEEQDRHPPARFNPTGLSAYSILRMVKIDSVDGEPCISVKLSRLRSNSKPDDLAKDQRGRIRAQDDELFKAVMTHFVYEKHSQDAWHLRTAQVFGCPYLVTMDRKFINLYKQHQIKLRAIGITSEVLSPSDLGKRLRIVKIPPNLFSYNDASFTVRGDLNLETLRPNRQTGGRGIKIDDTMKR